MSLINICRDNDDPFYRYKMPPIVSKVEGRGNGIKTNIVNVTDVARALTRPPAYVIKYFGFELGAQTTINEDQDRYIVNGAHDAAKLQDTLDGFINKFVLCGQCKNPETDFVIQKNGNILKHCTACGADTVVDPVHKLTSYIVKNPPTSSKSKKKGMANAASSTSAKNDASVDAGSKKKASKDDDKEDELTRRINAEAAHLPTVETKDEDVEWSADLSEEAVKARQKELEKKMAVLGIDEEEKVDPKKFDEFGEWVEEGDHSDVDIYKKALDLGVQAEPKAVQVLAQVLFTPKIVDEIEEHAGLLRKMITSRAHEKALLGGIERFIGLQHPELISKVPNVLFKLYENDLVSEEEVQHWGTKVSKRYVDKSTSKKVRSAAKPFLDWLENAESDESDSDDSE